MYGIFMECWVSFKLFFGNPFMAILFVASALYIAICEKDLKKKIILGFLPLLVMAGFLLPVTKIVYVAAFDDGSDTYYRLLWIMPMYLVMGYAICKIVTGFGRVLWQRVALVAALVVVMLTGSLVYVNQYMSVAENLYHIPQSAIDVCDVIKPAVGEARVRAVFPSDLVHYVRQYSTDILMPYGREMIVTQWDYYNEVYEVYEKPQVIDAEVLLNATRNTNCRYIVLTADRKINKNLTTLGLKLVKTVDKYVIYEDPQVAGQ